MTNVLMTGNTIMLEPDPTTPDARPPTGERAPDVPLLPLPPARCLTSEQAAAYLAIGVTLLADLDVPCVKLGRRRVYDKVDLDRWLDEYKRRGRARKEISMAREDRNLPATGLSFLVDRRCTTQRQARMPKHSD